MNLEFDQNNLPCGAMFNNGKITDSLSEHISKIERNQTKASWMLYSPQEAEDDEKLAYEHAMVSNSYCTYHLDEELIIFNKKGDDDFVEIAEVIKSYLDKSETHYMNAYGNNN